MRIFWIILVVIVVGGLAWMVMPAGGGGQGSGSSAGTTPVADARDTAPVGEPVGEPVAPIAVVEPPLRTDSATDTEPQPQAESAPVETIVTAEAAPASDTVAEAPAIEDAELAEATATLAGLFRSMTDVVEGLGGDPTGVDTLAADPIEPSRAEPDPIEPGSSDTQRHHPGHVDRTASVVIDPTMDTDAVMAQLEALRERGIDAPATGAIADALAMIESRETRRRQDAEFEELTARAARLEADGGDEAVPVAIDHVEAHDEGGFVIGGRWRVPGSGTADDPFVMRWEILRSAQRTYNPRLGKSDLPAWAETFEGKRVVLEGFVVLPLAQQSSTDVLITLNQWDGCCIGVPPTPYDAIEVSLVDPVEGTAQIGAFWRGRLEGTFSTDPYLAGGWLLGLYLINDAELTEFVAH